MNRDRTPLVEPRSAESETMRGWRAAAGPGLPRCPVRPSRPDVAAVRAWPSEPESVPAARRWLGETAGEWGLSVETGSSLALIVSELVTNAVRHSHGRVVTVLVARTAGAICLEVVDDGRWRHAVGVTDGLAEGGYGLEVVAACADRSGSERTAAGTCTWAVLARPLT